MLRAPLLLQARLLAAKPLTSSLTCRARAQLRSNLPEERSLIPAAAAAKSCQGLLFFPGCLLRQRGKCQSVALQPCLAALPYAWDMLGELEGKAGKIRTLQSGRSSRQSRASRRAGPGHPTSDGSCTLSPSPPLAPSPERTLLRLPCQGWPWSPWADGESAVPCGCLCGERSFGLQP